VPNLFWLLSLSYNSCGQQTLTFFSNPWCKKFEIIDFEIVRLHIGLSMLYIMQYSQSFRKFPISSSIWNYSSQETSPLVESVRTSSSVENCQGSSHVHHPSFMAQSANNINNLVMCQHLHFPRYMPKNFTCANIVALRHVDHCGIQFFFPSIYVNF
jgi:hypothetical protein